MRPEVHAAALRSAAKLVLGMASIASVTAACAASSESEPASNSQAVTSNTSNTDKIGDDDDATTTDGGLSAECASTLNAAFPGQDRYQWTPVKEPKDVVECCNEAFENDGFGAGHRWACCVSYDKLDAHGDPLTVAAQGHVGSACTPWGPPVPPRMNRRRKLSPARRDMNVALVTHMSLVA